MEIKDKKIENLSLKEIIFLAESGCLEQDNPYSYKLCAYVGELIINRAFNLKDEAFVLSKLNGKHLEKALLAANYNSKIKVDFLEKILEKQEVSFAQICYMKIAYLSPRDLLRQYIVSKIEPRLICEKSVQEINLLIKGNRGSFSKFLEIILYLKKNKKKEIIAKINQNIWRDILINAKGLKLRELEDVLDELLKVCPVNNVGVGYLSELIYGKQVDCSKYLLHKIILSNPELFAMPKFEMIKF